MFKNSSSMSSCMWSYNIVLSFFSFCLLLWFLFYFSCLSAGVPEKLQVGKRQQQLNLFHKHLTDAGEHLEANVLFKITILSQMYCHGFRLHKQIKKQLQAAFWQLNIYNLFVPRYARISIIFFPLVDVNSYLNAVFQKKDIVRWKHCMMCILKKTVKKKIFNCWHRCRNNNCLRSPKLIKLYFFVTDTTK